MGGDLVGQVIREAMAVRGLDRREVVDRLGLPPKKRSEWFQVLDRLRAGKGASARQLRRIAAAIPLDACLIQAAVADDEGEELHRYEQWEAWAWEPALPDHVFEVIAKGYGKRHPLPATISREDALAFARDLACGTQHWVSVPLFRSAAARLGIGKTEWRFYVGFNVPSDEVARFRLKSVALRGEGPK